MCCALGHYPQNLIHMWTCITQTVIIKALLSIHNAYSLVRVCIPAIANINAELDTANFKFEYKGYNLGKVILW